MDAAQTTVQHSGSPFLDGHPSAVFFSAGQAAESERDASTDAFATQMRFRNALSEQYNAISQYIYGLPRNTGLTSMDLEGVISELDEVAEYPSGWDGEDALPLSPEAYGWAKRFLNAGRAYLAVPTLTLNENGTLSLEWRNRYSYVHLELGKYLYALTVRRTGLKPIYRNDELHSTKALAREVRWATSFDPFWSSALSIATNQFSGEAV